MSAAIPFGYLSPEGRAAVKARADELQAYLAQRRAERQLTAALGPRRTVEQRVVLLRSDGTHAGTATRPMEAPHHWHAPRDLGPAFSDSVRGDLDVMVPA